MCPAYFIQPFKVWVDLTNRQTALKKTLEKTVDISEALLTI